MLFYSIVSKNDLNDNFQGCHVFSCNALKAGKQLDSHFHTLSVSSSFYLWNRKKRTFLESLNEHLKYNVISKTNFFQNVNFPSKGNLKIYSIQF